MMGHCQSGPAGGGGETVALRPQPWLLAVAGQWVLNSCPRVGSTVWCLRSSWAAAEPRGLAEAAPRVPTQLPCQPTPCPGRDAAPWGPAPALQFSRGNAFSYSKEAKIPVPAAGGLQRFLRLFPKSTPETQDWTPRGWSVPGAEAAAESAQPQFQQRLFPSGHRVRKRHSKERGAAAVQHRAAASPSAGARPKILHDKIQPLPWFLQNPLIPH